MRVLVLEDDADMRQSVAARLRQDAFVVDEVARVADAEDALGLHAYDCLVIDRMLPDGDGLDLVTRRRAVHDRTVVLFLTGLGQEADRVEGLDVGDDYLTKPFGLDELAARVRALCRRGGRARPAVVSVGDLEVDRATRMVHRAGVRIDLARKEFAILEVLVEEPGVVVSAEQLLERCWGDRVDLVTKSVTVHLSTLRRKLGDPPVIRTVHGSGYAIDPPH
jgi:two-component system copper resistance phosphate regulon response regulator CusR